MKKRMVVAVLAVLLVASTYAQTKDFFELVKSGTPQQVQDAISKGADVNAQTKEGWTPLISAVMYNQNVDVVTTLLKAGADPNASGNNGTTALLEAAMWNQNSEVIAALLEAGADIKARDKDSKTALMLAAMNNQSPKVVTILLEAGADTEARDSNGSTPLMWAVRYNNNPEVITILLKAGADVNAKDESGETPLMIATDAQQKPEVIIALQRAGAGVTVKNSAGNPVVNSAQNSEKPKDTDTNSKLAPTYKQTTVASLEFKDLSFDDIYPVFHYYYDTHPLGKVVLSNTTKQPITDIKVSFQIKEFMSDPKDCPAPSELGPGESKSVDLFGLFLPTILETTEKSRTQARVDVEYTLRGQVQHQSLVQSIPILDRNATTWADNRRAAAFVTTKDPAVLTFSKNVNSMVNGKIQGAVNPNLLTAIAFFQALQLFGLTYSQDPIPTSTANKQVADYIQFPRQTLQYKGGKCSDFSVLYSALLESVGIETAFITIPGHIFIAFSTGVSPDEARKAFSHADDLIFRNEKSWIPVEVTESAGFLQAWQDGAREWRENLSRNQAAFYPLHDAWQLYEPVGLPGAEVAVNLPPSEKDRERVSGGGGQVHRSGDFHYGLQRFRVRSRERRILENRPMSWGFSMLDMASTIGRKKSSRSFLQKMSTFLPS